VSLASSELKIDAFEGDSNVTISASLAVSSAPEPVRSPEFIIASTLTFPCGDGANSIVWIDVA
jgi:hypothetical protein